MYGFIGKMLFVDLSTKTYEVRELTEELAKNHLGGASLGARILFEEMPAHTDAFAKESVIGFVTGILNANAALFGGRYTVVSKSPVTGGWNDANSGGTFGPKLKGAGYDAVFVKGISEKPCYILIDNGEVSFHDADGIWGLTTVATETKLKEEYGKNVGIALISTAGENMHNIACVMNDEHRAAGRGGSGAVMGSKKLKAIVVRGNQKPEVADKEALLAINKQIAALMTPDSPAMQGQGTYGTGGGFTNSVTTGDAGIKNWAGSLTDYTPDKSDTVGARFIEKYKTKKYACHSCPLGCGALMDLPMEDGTVLHTARPEYETMGSFGSMCLIGKGEDVMILNHLCNEYGFDTISAGDTIAWVMECYDKGILTKDDLDGLDLSWGNAEGAIALLHKMGKGEGCGKIIGGGTKYAAEKFGKGFECLVTASGIELPMHDSRLSFNLARTFKYDPTPGRHTKGGIGRGSVTDMFSEEAGEADRLGVAGNEITNSCGICAFGGFTAGAFLHDTINCVSGFNLSEEDFITTGLRSFAYRNAFNVREGLQRKDFELSERMVKADPPFDGPLAGVTVDVEKMGDNFFKAMDMDPVTLKPSKKLLEELGGTELLLKEFY